MILLKGAEVSSKIKTEVLAAVSAMEGTCSHSGHCPRRGAARRCFL